VNHGTKDAIDVKTILLREELYKRSNLYAAPGIDHEITLETDKGYQREEKNIMPL
jgi:hypothetical protein